MDAPQHYPASYLQGCDPGRAEEMSLQGTTVMHLHPACSSAHDSCWAALNLLKDRHAHGTRDAATPCLLISTWLLTWYSKVPSALRFLFMEGAASKEKSSTSCRST